MLFKQHARLLMLGCTLASAVSTTKAFGAGCSGVYTCNETASGVQMGWRTTASGVFSTAMGHYTTASGDTSTSMGVNTHALGDFSTAMGDGTTALGDGSTANGYNTNASGDASTANGYYSHASGGYSTAMGHSTLSSGESSTAMGYRIEASANEALVNSGTISGKTLAFQADHRLISDARPADPDTLLLNVQALKVVTHVPSANVCRHHNRTLAECAGPAGRTIGLLAQQVAAVVPEAVTSVGSLKLTTGRHRAGKPVVGVRAAAGAGGLPDSAADSEAVVEHVEAVQSLDVHVLVAQLIGAVQSLSKQNQEQAAQIKELQFRP